MRYGQEEVLSKTGRDLFILSILMMSYLVIFVLGMVHGAWLLLAFPWFVAVLVYNIKLLIHFYNMWQEFKR